MLIGDITSLLQSYTKEVLFALALGLLSTTLLLSQPSHGISSSPNSSRSTPSTMPMMPLQIQPLEAFTQEELDTLTACYGEETPQGKFLKETHGVTHYQVEGVDNGPSAKGLVVLAHGIGTSYYAFEEFAQELVNAGYSVLSYDYYGHGYSKYSGDMFVDYDKDLFVDQLQDLLGFVEKETGEICVAMVGHSTGGIVCTAANERWGKGGDNLQRKVIPKLILAAPAFYAKKPFMARVADKIPGILTSIMRKVPSARVIIGDSYMEAGEIAFGRDPITKETVYVAGKEKKTQIDNVLFGNVKGTKAHPYLAGGILGINCHILRGDLLEGHRDMIQNVLKKDGAEKSEVLWIWGELDETVPYVDNLPEVKKWDAESDNFQLAVQERIGHEMFYENSQKIARVAIDYLDGA